MSNENNQVIFKTKCQGEFDELLPQALALIEKATGEKCTKEIILRFADLGKKAGTYSPIIKEGSKYHFCYNVTLNAQLIEHHDETKPIIAHELAHFVIDRIKAHHGINDRRGKWGVHGSEWKAADRSLGNTGERCHRLPVTTSKFKVRMTQRGSDGSEHHCWMMTRKDAKHCLADPKFLKVEVKNSEGFWIPFESRTEGHGTG